MRYWAMSAWPRGAPGLHLNRVGRQGIPLFGKRTRAAPAPEPAARKPQPAPYHWTQGAAPKAHWDMVPIQEGWPEARRHMSGRRRSPADGETRVVVDLLTQMTYVYRGDKLIGASTMSSAKDRATSRLMAIGRSSRSARSIARRSTTMRRCRSWSGSTITASPFMAASIPASRKPRLHAPADEVRREALRRDQDRHQGGDRGLEGAAGGKTPGRGSEQPGRALTPAAADPFVFRIVGAEGRGAHGLVLPPVAVA